MAISFPSTSVPEAPVKTNADPIGAAEAQARRMDTDIGNSIYEDWLSSGPESGHADYMIAARFLGLPLSILHEQVVSTESAALRVDESGKKRGFSMPGSGVDTQLPQIVHANTKPLESEMVNARIVLDSGVVLVLEYDTLRKRLLQLNVQNYEKSSMLDSGLHRTFRELNKRYPGLVLMSDNQSS